ncbi:MAG: hypothetical protein Q8N88_00450 [Nanoarchaeota archaeon]|nr:hypothetical protein [Nanoarchaeota archaeon]
MTDFERIDPKLKEEINKEGWEGDKEGGAAVFVGTKEEMEKAREIMEKEGRTEDLASYIRLHKEIALPYNEIVDEELKKAMVANKGHYASWPGYYSSGFKNEEVEHKLEYIDLEGNIARVNIKTNEIADIEKIVEQRRKVRTFSLGYEVLQALISEKLSSLGFLLGAKLDENIDLWDSQKFRKAKEDYKKKLEQEVKEKKKHEFDF